MLEIVKPKSVIAGVDFGYINPSVILVIAVDGDDILYVIDELYQSGLTIKELIQKGLDMKIRYNVGTFHADPSQPAYIRQMNNEGLHTIPACNDILPGISAVCEKLKLKGDGKPSLYIDEKCENLIFELQNYRYAEGDNGTGCEMPVKKNDHACDALRYAVYSMKNVFRPKSFKAKWL